MTSDGITSDSIIDEAFTNGFNEANDLYNEGILDRCIEKSYALLNDPAIPIFHRIKTLILLASTLGDWNDANEHRIEAETLWRAVRRWHPQGRDTIVDEHMTEIRGTLDELDAVLREEELEDIDVDEPMMNSMEASNEGVQDTQTEVQESARYVSHAVFLRSASTTEIVLTPTAATVAGPP
jgi:hypothetical protein